VKVIVDKGIGVVASGVIEFVSSGATIGAGTRGTGSSGTNTMGAVVMGELKMTVYG
jgi:hypothetical protein